MSDKPLPPIGFVGKMGHGKSTAGKALELLGYVRAHPFEPGRAMLKALLKFYDIPEDKIDRYLEGDLKREVIPEIGWSGTYLQQTLGTEWGRNCVSQTLWTDLVNRRFRSQPHYNDSIRFISEAEDMLDKGGFLIRIVNPHLPASDSPHSSETEQECIGVHYLIQNDGSKLDLWAKVIKAVAILQESYCLPRPEMRPGMIVRK